MRASTRAAVAVAAALALGVALSGARASPGAAGAVSLTDDSSQPVRRAPRPPGAAAGQTNPGLFGQLITLKCRVGPMNWGPRAGSGWI